MARDPLGPRDLEALGQLARVEPPAELDAWVRAKLRAAVAEQAPVPAGSRANPPLAPVSVPLGERLALAIGTVACGVQVSAFVLRMIWSALSLGR